jgi:hypothetical protein
MRLLYGVALRLALLQMSIMKLLLLLLLLDSVSILTVW